MISPSEKNNEHGHSPSCLDISPERLNRMSPSELADAMEEALDFMTEETYDPDIISAYLEALDRVSSIPEHPNAEEAYASFKRKLNALAGTNEAQNQPPVSTHTSGRYRIWHTGLAAALIVVVLFGSMMIAQALGLDVFGAIARWTEEAFSFGALPTDKASNNPSTKSEERPVNSQYTEVPAEYSDIKAAMEKRGIPFCFPKIPAGFEVVQTLMYTMPSTEKIQFSVGYMKNDDFISFEFSQYDGAPKTVYEKDKNNVEVFNYNNIPHYIFRNEGDTVAVWLNGDLEYSVSSNTDSIDLKQIIRSFYEE